jgi:hypothetical protein
MDQSETAPLTHVTQAEVITACPRVIRPGVSVLTKSLKMWRRVFGLLESMIIVL